ncbi:MAG TPA: patatin-like phospholipase family protein [Cellvibrio sp.]|nr:patatin-like phospholipase family protein [Cellvibrio sp.]
MKRCVIFVILGLLLPAAAFAAEAQRTALVLGGGGARGSAHIGVLEILERERIPVDCVVGTSMGGLVAGSYAAGLSPKDMREKLAKADWTDMFLDLADYSQVSYRKKRISGPYLTATEIGITSNGMQIQPGMVAGEKIKLFFNQLVDADLGEREIQELPLPLAIVATDIGTGERVVLQDGSLTKAMRATMSVPGLMAPVELNGRKLVDGGLVDNVPVAVARDLCKADRIIAVNVGSPLRPAESIGSLLSVTGQMIGILTQQNVHTSLSSLREGDIYIAPELGEITATDFVHYDKAADRGKAAAEKQIAALRNLSVSEQEYSAWRHNMRDQRKREILIDKVVIAPVTLVHPEYVARQIEQQEGELLDRVKLEQDLIRTYGDGFYESVDYRVITQDQKNVLEITAKTKHWSADYIVFGFSLESEHKEGSNFNIRSAYRNTWLNSYGGEFFASVNLGNQPAFEVDYYQPLNHRQSFFIEPSYSRGRETIGLFADDRELATYNLDRAHGDFLLGANIGIFGEATVGWRDYKIKGDAEVSTIPLPDVDEDYGGTLIALNMDKRNRLYFPSRGWLSNISYFDSGEENYSKLSVDISGAYKLGEYVIAARTAYGGAVHGELPFYDSMMLGGFLNMSGYASNQILGDDAYYAHIRAERIIGRMPLGLNGDMRVGFALEAATLGVNYTMENEEVLDSAVIYLGGETPFGPLYLGYGFTFEGNYNLYFKLGAF